MASHQLTDVNALGESFIIPKETWALFSLIHFWAEDCHMSSKLYPSAMVEYGPLIVSNFTLDLIFYSSRLSLMNLKVPTAKKMNFLNSYPREITKLSTECKQCDVHIITNGYSRRREEENGSFLSTENCKFLNQ